MKTLGCTEGVWNGTSDCQLPPCSPISVTQAVVNVSWTSGATVANVSCQGINTFVDGSTQKTHVCLLGAWSPPVQDCVVRCPNLTVDSATVSQHIDSNDQQQAVVVCYPGYHFPDNTTRKTLSCSTSGSWSEPSVAGCILTTCNETSLTRLSHTSMSTIQTIGDAILKRVTCENGYQFPDQTTSRVYGCDGGGLWYPSLDNCTVVECATVQGQTNAAILSESRVYQGTVTLTCTAGWSFADGNVSRVHVCQANKTWSPSPEYCLRKFGPCFDVSMETGFSARLQL
ncbi:CUB and sushi domain-containing protein 2-like [Babylonia areolata]|uniref:CUB and sushi domain-containing protein 2-like n=1 Tax=Babylonia areolata TaxID=304850 RepID=UPI003FD5217F